MAAAHAALRRAEAIGIAQALHHTQPQVYPLGNSVTPSHLPPPRLWSLSWSPQERRTSPRSASRDTWGVLGLLAGAGAAALLGPLRAWAAGLRRRRPPVGRAPGCPAPLRWAALAAEGEAAPPEEPPPLPVGPAVPPETILDIEKPPRDHRQYRYCKLPCGLQVLYISDHLCDSAAAAVTLDVGSLDDPWDRLGLTHFLEHMLFLGTRSYPKEDDFEAFVNAHGGACNAGTGLTHTTFHFTVGPAALEGALDRFLRFFAEPTFSPAAVGREVQAIDAEHRDGLLNDDLRLHQILRSLATPGHPFGKFANGTAATLLGPRGGAAAEQSLSAALWAFFREQYTLPRMALCVLGREPLPDLQALVDRTVAQVLANPPAPAMAALSGVQIQAEVWPAPPAPLPGLPPQPSPPDSAPVEGPPFIPEALGQMLWYKPVTPMERITILWPVPRVDRTHPYAMPSDLIAHLLVSQHKGSLGALLTDLGWLEGSSCGIDCSLREYEMLRVQLDLTEEGSPHKADIAAFVFRFLDGLLDAPTADLQRAHRTLQSMWQLEYQFWQESEPQWTVESLSENLFVYPPQRVLSGEYYLQWDETLLRSYLSLLRPDNSIVVISSAEDFDGAKGVLVKEPWFDAPYKAQPLKSTPIEARALRVQPLTAAALEAASKQVRFPGLNPWLPTDLRLRAEQPRTYRLACQGEQVLEGLDERERLQRSAPLLLDGRRPHRLWHKLDGTYRQPRLCTSFHLPQPDPKVPLSGVDQHRLNAFLQLLEEVLVEELQSAEDAGLYFDSSLDAVSVSFEVWGFSQHLPTFLDLVFRTLRAIIATALADPASDQVEATDSGVPTVSLAELQTKFRTVRYRMIREQEEELRAPPLELLTPYVRYLLMSHGTHPDETLSVLRTDAYLNLSACAIVMQRVLRGCQLEAFFHGNADAREAADLRRRAVALLCPHLLPSLDAAPAVPAAEWDAGTLELQRARELPLGTVMVEVISPNEDETTCGVEYHLQVGPTLDWAAKPPLDRLPAVTLEVINHIANASAFATLRTENQLGYVVQTNVYYAGNAQGLSVLVQSPTATPEVVVARIEAWLRTELDDKLSSMSEEEFATQVAAVRTLKSERHTRLASEAEAHQAAMGGLTYDFGAPERDLQCLGRLTLADVRDMWRRRLHPDAPQRRCLIAQAVGPEAAGRYGTRRPRRAPPGGLQRRAAVAQQRAGWPPYPMLARRPAAPTVAVQPVPGA